MTQTATAPTTRYFGRCYTTTCTYRTVRDMNQNEAGRECSNGRCPECRNLMKYRSLDAKLNLDKRCTARCEASQGPSCSCACGGENHGSTHL